MEKQAKTLQPIVLFDGVCNLCNSTVQFIIRNDKKSVFQFAALQSEAGQKYLKKFKLSTSDFDTFVLVEGARHYTRSTAALQLLRRLNMPWALVFPLIVIPKFIRDSVYNFVAKNRYKWFGKKDQCMIPSPETIERFLK